MAKISFLILLVFTISGCDQITALIGSFVSTTAMSQPESMRLSIPGDEKSIKTLPSQNYITILIYDETKLYCYKGSNITAGLKFSLGKVNSIRDYLQKMEADKKDDLVVIIKPLSSSSYKGVVDILDEMSINDIKRYSLVDPLKDEEQFVKQLK